MKSPTATLDDEYGLLSDLLAGLVLDNLRDDDYVYNPLDVSNPLDVVDFISGYTSLHLAAQTNDIELAFELLMQRVDADIISVSGKDNGLTAMHMAAERGYIDFMEILMRFPGRGGYRDSELTPTPLHHAIKSTLNVKTKIEVIKFLIKNGANLNEAIYERTPINLTAEVGEILTMIAEMGDTSTMKYFIVENKIDINLVNRDGYMAIHSAVAADGLQMVKYLISIGANVNSYSSHNYTPLAVARQYGHKNVRDFLEKAGAHRGADADKNSEQQIDVLLVLSKYNERIEDGGNYKRRLIADERYKEGKKTIFDKFSNKGLQIKKEVGDDGNCFFYAMESLLEIGHEELRAIAVDHIRSNLPHYRNFFAVEDEMLQEEISRIGENGEWSGDEVISALADSLGINIRIYRLNVDGSNNEVLVMPRIGSGITELSLFLNINHYEPLTNEANESAVIDSIDVVDVVFQINDYVANQAGGGEQRLMEVDVVSSNQTNYGSVANQTDYVQQSLIGAGAIASYMLGVVDPSI